MPHAHSGWGVLHGRQQLLVALAPGLSHAERDAVQGALEAAGGYISGWIPETTLLVVGDAGVADIAEAHEHVHWVGEFHEGLKLAPDWGSVLDWLEAQPEGGGAAFASLAASGKLPQGLSSDLSRVLSGIAADAAAAAMSATAGDGAHGHVAEQAGESSPGPGGFLIGIVVSFPPSYETTPRRSGSSSSSESPDSRAAPSTGAGTPSSHPPGVHLASPAEAAVADWAPELSARFQDAVSLEAHGTRHAVVRAPAALLREVLQWLAVQPAVHWLEPKYGMRLHNANAASIIQAAQPAPDTKDWSDEDTHPIWAAGLKGSGQIVGCGDSGIELNHCFFEDDSIDLSVSSSNWQPDGRGGRLYNGTADHRKVALYYAAYGDSTDSIGHGTHVVGSICGAPPGGDFEQGMAPDARVAFWDLAAGASDMVMPPNDLERTYYLVSYEAGARIHSDSWGSMSKDYDIMATQVDMFTWEHQDFLPMFAAGNDGEYSDMRSGGERFSGERTVTSPGTCKNCITVGATDSVFSSAVQGLTEFTTFDMRVRSAAGAPGSELQFRAMVASFGSSPEKLGDEEYALSVAEPPEACTPLTNEDSIQGTIVVIIRGTCLFADKASYAERAGAAAVLVYDNEAGSYFTPDADDGTAVNLPVMGVPRRIGAQLVTAMQAGMMLYATLSPSTPPANEFDNLAAYSSQGPTTDGRFKPDIVAPGTTLSAHVFAGQCGTEYMQGTSMATPVVAGAAALVRQYFEDGFYPSGKAQSKDSHAPGGALVKAILLGGALPLTGFEADTGLPIDPPPSSRQGFGRVYLHNSLPLEGSSWRVQIVDGATIGGEETHRYCVKARGDGELRITLTWFDYPGLESTGAAIVNDLDLSVRAAGFNGTLILGNGGGAVSAAGADRVNTVEQVVLLDLPEGDVSIEVTGFQIYGKASPQPYALVVLGAFEGVLASDANPGMEGEDGRTCEVAVVSITGGPEGLTNQDPVSFEFKSVADAEGNVECRLTSPDGDADGEGMHAWRECSSPAQYDGLPDSSYLFSVRAGGDGGSVASRPFILDTTPPSLEWDASPPEQTAQSVATLNWTASDQSAIQASCRLRVEGGAEQQGPVFDGAGREYPLGKWVEECKPPLRMHWLLPGSYSFQINASDEAGNWAGEPASRDWTVQFEPGTPYVRITGGLFGPTASSGGDFNFVVLEADETGSLSERGEASTECAFEAADAGVNYEDVDPSKVEASWEGCASPVSQADLEDGTYLFMARMADSRRRRTLLDASQGDTYAVSLFNVDSTPPEVTITKSPSEFLPSSTADFAFKANDPAAKFTCELRQTARADGGSSLDSNGNEMASACTSPASYPNLVDGEYEFVLTAEDVVGNKAEPRNVTFMVDTRNPQVESVDYPAATREGSISISWSATDGNGSGIATTKCAMYPIPVKEAPEGDGEDGASVQGDSTSPVFEDCESPVSYDGLTEGVYGFELQLTDRANLTSLSAPYTIAVDTTPPTVSVSSGPSEGDPSPSTVEFALKGDDGSYGSNVTTFQCKLSTQVSSTTQKLQSTQLTSSGSASGQWENCTSPKVYRGLDSGGYAFQARAIDAAGNEGEATGTYSFSVDASLPVPETDTPDMDDGGSSTFPFSTLTLVAIIVGASLLGLSLIGILIDIIKRCARRRHPPLPPGAAGRPGQPGAGPGRMDPELHAAIQASLAETHRPPAYAPYASGAAPVPAGGYYPYPPPPQPQWAPPYTGAVAVPPGPLLYPAAAPPAPARSSRGAAAPAAAAAAPPPPVLAPPPPFAGGPGARSEEDATLEAAIQASLAETQRAGSGGLVGDDAYRTAVQASLDAQFEAARQRQASLGPSAPPLAGGRPATPDDPDIRAAIQASLQDAQRGRPSSRGGAGGGLYPNPF